MTKSKLGRPKSGESVDYFKKFEAERKRNKRLQQHILKLQDGQKLQRARQKIASLKKKYKRLSRNYDSLRESSVRFGQGKSYVELASRQKRVRKSLILRMLCGGSPNLLNESIRVFALDLINCAPSALIIPTLESLLAQKKCGTVFQKYIVEKSRKLACADKIKRTRDFVDRKKQCIGRKKKNASRKNLANSMVEISGMVVVEPVSFPCQGRNDVEARKILRQEFPFSLPIAIEDDSIKIEHAFIEIEAMTRAATILIYTCVAIQSSFHWFWDVKNQSMKVHHFELSTFFDGFAIFGGTESCSIFCLRILNLAAVLQRPEFNLMVFAIKSKETAGATIKLLNYCAGKLVTMLESGITLEFRGYPDDQKVPHSNIALNGVHNITFGRKNLFAADGKAAYFAQGCTSANQTYCPVFELPTELYCSPDAPVSDKNYVPYALRVQRFLLVDQFRNRQRNIFMEEARQLKRESWLPHELSSKITASWKRLMVTAVNNYARSIKTSCCHLSPIPIADLCGVCSLHMDTNEFLRVLQRVVLCAADLSVEHNLAPVFACSTSSDAAIELPDITSAHPDAPLVRVIAILEKNKLKRVATYFKNYYTPPMTENSKGAIPSYPPNELDIIADWDAIFELPSCEAESPNTVAQKRAQRIRMIGQQVEILSPIFPHVVDCLRAPCINGVHTWPDGAVESMRELESFITCWTYVHLLRSLSALYAAWVMTVGLDEVGAFLMGDLFVRLVHRFNFHRSTNTFFFAQIAPFVMDYLKDNYRLSNSKALSIGSCCRNEGGELTCQTSKGQIKYWTPRRKGFLRSLLNQRTEIYLGGMNLFPDACPTVKNILDPSAEGRTRIQKFGKLRPGCCETCNSHPAIGTLQAALEELGEMYTDFELIAQHANFSPLQFLTTLQETKFKGLTLEVLFENFLQLHSSKLVCIDCAKMAILLVSLLFGTQNGLPFVHKPELKPKEAAVTFLCSTAKTDVRISSTSKACKAAPTKKRFAVKL